MILACDIGTTTVKVGIIDHKGELKAYGRLSLSDPYGRQFSAREWRRAFKQAVHELDAAVVKKIRAVVISGNGPSLVHVLLWHRQPAASNQNGSRRSYFLPLLARLKASDPRIYEKTNTVLPCPEYICYLLTGRAAALLPNSAFRDYYWSDKEITELGLDREIFPELIDLSAAFGKTTRSAGSELAIPCGVPVYCGGPDFLMALLGSGVIVPGCTLDRAGSSEGINHCAAQKIVHGNLRTLPGLLRGTYNVSGILPMSGRLLEQAAGSFFPRSEVFKAACFKALTVKPGSRGLLFIPRLMQKNIPHGNKNPLGSFLGLRVDHGPHEKLRAVMEALAMQLGTKLKILREQGFDIGEMTICGGQTRSPGLVQMKADILKVVIKPPVVTDAELMGGACAAYYALGEYHTLRQAAQNMVRFSQEFKPRKEYSRVYDDLFGRFCTHI
jgi:xylulokinase